MITYTSYGAARQVTGSMHLLNIHGYNLLLDCGLDYERDDFGNQASNLNFEFNPAQIDAVILSHAHIDHSGNIPNLIRQGFEGKIYCTPATAMLVQDLWSDSLNIQRSDQRKNKRNKKSTEVLYAERHIELARRQIVEVTYNRALNIADDIQFEFYQSGHIPGAASVTINIKSENKTIRIGFSGDLGNFNAALMKDPEPISDLDYFISESTYGGRYHTNEDSRTKAVFKHIKETCIDHRGKLIIPAFSIGRTQAILFTIHQLYREGRIPEWLKIYTDSPLAIRSTRVYSACLPDLNQEAQEFYHQHGDLFQFNNLKTIVEPAQSDYISQSQEPCVIVSAAGMLEGGRIQKHIRNNIGFQNNRVLIAGYCSEGTLGAKLLEGLPTIRINKKEKKVEASIARTDAFSAHADTNGLLRYYKSMKVDQLKQLFFVHGDEESMLALKNKTQYLYPSLDITLPFKGEEYVLD